VRKSFIGIQHQNVPSLVRPGLQAMQVDFCTVLAVKAVVHTLMSSFVRLLSRATELECGSRCTCDHESLMYANKWKRVHLHCVCLGPAVRDEPPIRYTNGLALHYNSPAICSNQRASAATFFTAASLCPSRRSGRRRLSSYVYGMVRKQISAVGLL
jgi:hypothetical protein